MRLSDNSRMRDLGSLFFKNRALDIDEKYLNHYHSENSGAKKKQKDDQQ